MISRAYNFFAKIYQGFHTTSEIKRLWINHFHFFEITQFLMWCKKNILRSNIEVKFDLSSSKI